ncbi:MAG: deoxyhypusine synthase [Planctomycetota bacterium]|nr:MAG: deoxyhypusine synthase [Planctomycetota bacterium]
MSISAFLDEHFRHFNARETVDAARAWRAHLERGGKMLLAMAGAMSTAEIGRSLARLIREDKVHAISCTAANLEEDVFNLLAHDEYRTVPHYRDLAPADEERLRDEGLNRVTDTCIPETVIRHVEGKLLDYWVEASERGESYFPCEYLFRALGEADVARHFQIPPTASWAMAAREAGIPVFTPGWEDSTLGNIFAARVIDGAVRSHAVVRTGTEQMQQLVDWYLENQDAHPLGFFQIGGGIAGDFAICSVPLIRQDLERPCASWSYFAQISDSTTSYGSYSGAVPSEKITWHKLDADTPTFMINSDASIVAPLIFAYVLGE